MKIRSFSKILTLPILVLFGVVYYFSEYVDRNYSVFVFIPAVIAVVVYIFHGNIDHWYLKKNPAGLDPEIVKWLQRFFKPYALYDAKSKAVFEQRLEWYLDGRLFQAMGTEIKEVPEDLKVLVASFGVNMALYKEDYLIGDFDRIFLYKHHFPTPKNHKLHAVETDHEDGVIILNYDLVAKALLQPESYYNVAVHAYAEAMLHVYGNIPYWEESSDFEKVIGWTKDDILGQTGLNDLDNVMIHIHHFFVFNEKYQQSFPVQAELLKKYFSIPR